jgi:hypothetical protein
LETSPTIHTSGFPTAHSDYDSCLMIRSPATSDDTPVIRGQFCHLDIPQILPTWEQYQKDPIKQDVFDKIKMAIDEISKRTYHTSSENRMENFTLYKTTLEDMVFIVDWSKSFRKLPVTLCLPNTCSTKDIEKAINKGLN